MLLQIRGIWGKVEIYLDKLLDCRSCGWLQVESRVTARVLPLCDWLQARAFGITDLQLTQRPNVCGERYCNSWKLYAGASGPITLDSTHQHDAAQHKGQLCNSKHGDQAP
ncbi:hypothetical protein WJX73_002620 [Symbiochloris irregularis]|uniref:Uncharacterized protein n=1 Tax=Symbiochloris irregularis TaxID=706552 RepID=A0AAW1NVK2_9CHLO